MIAKISFPTGSYLFSYHVKNSVFIGGHFDHIRLPLTRQLLITPQEYVSECLLFFFNRDTAPTTVQPAPVGQCGISTNVCNEEWSLLCVLERHVSYSRQFGS